MKTYRVLVREVHISHMEVRADDPDDAIFQVEGGAGEEKHLEYSHTLDSSTWTVTSEGKTFSYVGNELIEWTYDED